LPCSVNPDDSGGEVWEFFGDSNYERAICRFDDNQIYNAEMDPNLPQSSATKNYNLGELSTVSIGATQTRFFFGFEYCTQPMTIVVDGMVLLSVSNNVPSSSFPISQSGKTCDVTLPDRLIPGNVIQWYATGNPNNVSSNNLIYTQIATANGTATATYYNEGGVFELQVPSDSRCQFSSPDNNVCVCFTIGQVGLTAKTGCGCFCVGHIPNGNQDWQYGQCSSFDDEFEQESNDW
jgi:hypothetical protein